MSNSVFHIIHGYRVQGGISGSFLQNDISVNQYVLSNAHECIKTKLPNSLILYKLVLHTHCNKHIIGE